jgi:hypothetical protein
LATYLKDVSSIALLQPPSALCDPLEDSKDRSSPQLSKQQLVSQLLRGLELALELIQLIAPGPEPPPIHCAPDNRLTRFITLLSH